MAAKVPRSRPTRKALPPGRGAVKKGKHGIGAGSDGRSGKGSGRGRDSDRGHRKARSQGQSDDGRSADRKASFAAQDSQDFSFSTVTHRRVPVDPDTKQYFVQLSAMIDEGGAVSDPEERATLSANALEEASGKELQLACDATCSRVLESLLVSADVNHLLLFLRGCSPNFASMSMDFAGSHVAEAALQSITFGLRDGSITSEWYSGVESALESVCEVMGKAAVDLMCSKYGSHVLRTLLAVCSGILLEDTKQGKTSSALASRLSVSAIAGAVQQPKKPRFPRLLKSLVDGILSQSASSMSRLRCDPAAGPVLQALLKALEGDEDTVTRTVSVILECNQESYVREEGMVLQAASVTDILESMKDRNSSHLFEVVLHAVPDNLFVEMFQRFFRHHLLELSLHESANFVVQALISAARHEGQVNMIFDELGERFAELIKERRAGVIASIVAACARFHTRQREVCRSLAHAVNPKANGSTGLIIRILHLDHLFTSSDDNGPLGRDPGTRMSVIGSAILQRIFSFPLDCSQQYSTSLVAMTTEEAVATVQDVSGCRVVEAFLASSAPPKLKQRCIAKLKGHFGELAMHPVCSFTVEKCYSVADMRLKESIVSELRPLQAQLLKTKHGPYLLRRCDVETFVKAPDQWKAKQTAKHGTRSAFAELFTDDNVKEQKGAEVQATEENVENDRPQGKEKEEQLPAGAVSKVHAGRNVPTSSTATDLSGPRSGKKSSASQRNGLPSSKDIGLIADGASGGTKTVKRGAPNGEFLSETNGGDAQGTAPSRDSSKKRRKKRKADRILDVDSGTGKRKKRPQMMFS